MGCPTLPHLDEIERPNFLAVWKKSAGKENCENYYPFGLTFNSFYRESSLVNSDQYNDKELQDELNLGWIDYGARMYTSELGRWQVIDPLSEKFTSFTPYNYCLGNPILLIDPDGMASKYNWGSGAYYDDANGNGTQDMEEGIVTWNEVQQEYGMGDYSKVTHVALFPEYDPAGGGGLLHDEGPTGGLSELLESAQINQDIQGTYLIRHVKNASGAAAELKKLPGKVKGLIIASHSGLYDAYFMIGSEVFDRPEDVEASPGLARIARTLAVDAEIIFTACNLGSSFNGGEELLKAASSKLRRTVYGNKSFTPGSDRMFQGGTPYYTGHIPGYHPEENGYTQAAYNHRGNWARVSYDKGNTVLKVIRKPYFDSFGKFRYK